MAHRSAPRHAGFALVEVLLCALLLAFATATLGAALRAAWGATASAATASQAVASLGDLAESLRAVGATARPAVVAAWRLRVARGGGTALGSVSGPEDSGASEAMAPVWRAGLSMEGRQRPLLQLTQPIGVSP